MLNSLVLNNLFHILFVVPLVTYFAYWKQDVSGSALMLLASVAIMIMLYHGYRYVKVTNHWINLMHVVFGAYFLVIAGLTSLSMTPKWMYLGLYVLAFSALLANGRKLYMRTMKL